MLAARKVNPQEGDVKFPLSSPNGPTYLISLSKFVIGVIFLSCRDSISSISCNGFGNTPTNMVIATSWDCSVNLA